MAPATASTSPTTGSGPLPNPPESPATNTIVPEKATAIPSQTRGPSRSRRTKAAPKGTQIDSVATRTALEATLV